VPYPPQGLSVTPASDQLITLFKSRDPRGAVILDSAELLVNNGLLTIDDVAKFINDVATGAQAAGAFQHFSTSFILSLLNNTNLSVSKVAAIFNEDIVPISRIVAILANTSLPIATVKSIFASSSLGVDRAQSILYAMVDYGYYDRLQNLFTFDASDASITTNTTLSTGVNRYRNLSISSGVTLTLGASPGVIMADTVSNSGTIASGWVKGAGGGGYGGSGRGGVIILARSISPGTVTANGGDGANYGYRIYPGGPGAFWVISGDTVPYGGNGGGVYGAAGNPNGGGGGSSSAYPGGAGGSATITTFNDGVSLLRELLKAVADWWLVNVLGRTPTTTKSIPSLGGSGGGCGYYTSSTDYGGSGGGGGGEIIIYGTTVNGGSLSANGGKGGNGCGTIGDGGGGGGGGGIIYVFYKTLQASPSFSVSGGSGGTAYQNGGAGGSGVARTIAV
jgi:hypothetical protein